MCKFIFLQNCILTLLWCKTNVLSRDSCVKVRIKKKKKNHSFQVTKEFFQTYSQLCVLLC